MSSILENPNLNKIFLIYGHLDDMFIARDLQKTNFRPFLNDYLKSLGYQQVVFYSGAKNVGKFVLDDESAVLAINKNKNVKSETALPKESKNEVTEPSAKPEKKRRIMNPRAKAAKAKEAEEQTAVKAEKVTAEEAIKTEPVQTEPTKAEQVHLVYRQPKITPVEFLEDAKKMMADSSKKSAVVFTFLQDFFTDRSAPLQPYLELVSHLWDEYKMNTTENICIFLAPQMSGDDLKKMFDSMENGFVLKNRFFNSNGTINRGTTIEIGLPNEDEVGLLLEHLRIIGDGGKKITYTQKEKEKLVTSIVYLSREADRDRNKSGYLHAIYNTIVSYMKQCKTEVVPIDDVVIQSLYSAHKRPDDTKPMEKLKNTRGWENVANRMEEIIRDFHMKKEAFEKKHEQVQSFAMKNQGAFDIRNTVGNDRIDKRDGLLGFRYPVPHFVLRGNPGVGKTTVARLIGQIFYEEGILKKGTLIEAKRDDLVDAYVGGTAIKTTERVEEASEGVLFIDDAYSLLEKGDEHNYPKEAIDTLVPIMTNSEKYRFCLIMAGYPEPMDQLLEMNSGLRSRFSSANIITIEDYPPDLLKEIFINDCHKDGYRFEGEEKDTCPYDLELFFQNLYKQRNRADFGNARDIVALAKEVKMQCSLRDDTTRCIKEEDFGEAAKYFIKRGVTSIDEIFEKIDRYVGMDFVKDLFKNIRYEVLDARDSKERGIQPESYPDHYIFAGNPGTGKTTVGKMIGEFYHMMEVLGGADTLFVDASDLIGNHVGDSKEKVNEVMQKAIDHNQVLYIDEAYQISESAYGNEIIGAMMTRMTENADDFKVIFGMYAGKVEAFLKMNAGLSRRLRIVNFPDYTPPQLLEIFERTVKAQGCTITEEALERVRLILTHKYNVRGEDFGNAGEVKKLVVDMRRLRLERTFGDNDGQVDRYLYTLEDIPKELLKMVEDQVNPKTLDDIMEELNQQIGMSDLKDIIIGKQEELIYAQRSGEGMNEIRPGYYFFVGNPGTGKSTSAKLFAECLKRLGVVKTNRFYSCTAKDLIGQYVGETDKKTYALLQKSINSVLFIDEAYSLSYADSHSDTNFKKEALEQMIAFMDEPEHRRNCCIILAGYEKDMQGLYKSNSGMRSRIEEVHFKDYSAEECYDIFALFCKKGGYTISDGVREAYVPLFEELKKLKYFSNGRTARTIFEKTTANLKHRIAWADHVEPGEAKLILPEDLLSVSQAVAIIGVDEK